MNMEGSRPPEDDSFSPEQDLLKGLDEAERAFSSPQQHPPLPPAIPIDDPIPTSESRSWSPSLPIQGPYESYSEREERRRLEELREIVAQQQSQDKFAEAFNRAMQANGILKLADTDRASINESVSGNATSSTPEGRAWVDHNIKPGTSLDTLDNRSWHNFHEDGAGLTDEAYLNAGGFHHPSSQHPDKKHNPQHMYGLGYQIAEDAKKVNKAVAEPSKLDEEGVADPMWEVPKKGIERVPQQVERARKHLEQKVITEFERLRDGMPAEERLKNNPGEIVLRLGDLSPVSAQRILREIDARVLSVAIKDLPLRQQEKIFSLLSKRGADILREDVEYLKNNPESATDSEQARARIGDLFNRLNEEGELDLLSHQQIANELIQLGRTPADLEELIPDQYNHSDIGNLITIQDTFIREGLRRAIRNQPITMTIFGREVVTPDSNQKLQQWGEYFLDHRELAEQLLTPAEAQLLPSFFEKIDRNRSLSYTAEGLAEDPSGRRYEGMIPDHLRVTPDIDAKDDGHTQNARVSTSPQPEFDSMLGEINATHQPSVAPRPVAQPPGDDSRDLSPTGTDHAIVPSAEKEPDNLGYEIEEGDRIFYAREGRWPSFEEHSESWLDEMGWGDERTAHPNKPNRADDDSWLDEMGWRDRPADESNVSTAGEPQIPGARSSAERSWRDKLKRHAERVKGNVLRDVDMVKAAAEELGGYQELGRHAFSTIRERAQHHNGLVFGRGEKDASREKVSGEEAKDNPRGSERSFFGLSKDELVSEFFNNAKSWSEKQQKAVIAGFAHRMGMVVAGGGMGIGLEGYTQAKTIYEQRKAEDNLKIDLSQPQQEVKKLWEMIDKTTLLKAFGEGIRDGLMAQTLIELWQSQLKKRLPKEEQPNG